MNALLALLQSRKITVSLVGSDLSIDAPEGGMTDDLLAEIRKHKTELVSTLQSLTKALSSPLAAYSSHAERMHQTDPIPIKSLSRDELVICIRELENELGEPKAVIDEYWGMIDLQVWLKKLEAGKPVQIRLTPQESVRSALPPAGAFIIG